MKKTIDAFKGIAIIGVVMVHLGIGNIKNNYVIETINSGARGVQIFFLISSYLIFASLARFYKQNPVSVKSTLGWIMKKIVRLIPLYYLAMMISLVMGRYAKIGDIIIHFLFMHGLTPYYCNSIIGIEWYIGTLVILYLISPLLYKVIYNTKIAVYALLISIFGVNIYYFGQLAFFNNIEYLQDKQVLQDYFGSYCIIAQLPIVFMGILGYYLILKLENNIKSKNTSYLLFGIFTTFCIIFTINKLIPFSMWGIVFCGLIYSQVINESKLINNFFFILCGKYSYGIYLFHVFVIQKLPRIEMSNTYAEWGINYVLVISCSLIVSILLTHIVEKPFIHFFNIAFERIHNNKM